MENIIFGILIVMVFGWFFLYSKFVTVLKERHSDIYESMGAPRLFSNNIPGDISLFKFIAKREWRTLDDRKLSGLGNFMILYFVLIQIIGIAMVCTIASKVVP